MRELLGVTLVILAVIAAVVLAVVTHDPCPRQCVEHRVCSGLLPMQMNGVWIYLPTTYDCGSCNEQCAARLRERAHAKP